jgi:hypothetical protein
MGNISNALKYLESRKVKLVNIRPIDIADGKPVSVLALVWTLILHYQVYIDLCPSQRTLLTRFEDRRIAHVR